MSFAFKRFNFFQPQQISRHGFPPNASCVVPGGSLLWAGTESGSVCVLDSRLCLVGSFNAHGHKVLEVLWLERRQLLVTVGIEEPGCSSTTVKLWSGEKLVAATAATVDGGGAGGPGGSSGAAGGLVATGPSSPAGIAASMTALKVTKVFGYHAGQQYPESPVTAAAAAEGGSSGTGFAGLTGTSSGGGGGGGGLGASGADASSSLTVALGLASGSVVVLVGEVHAAPAGGTRAKLSHSRRLSARPDEGDLLSVTGLELTGTSDLLSLFAVTESQTLCFHLQTNTKTVLDPQGSPATRCCCLRPGGSLLTVARAEGLYDYTVDTRAGCTVFDGTKQRLTTFGRYLVVVTRDDSSAAASSNLLSGGGLGGGGGGGLGLVGVSPLHVGVGVGAAGGFGSGGVAAGSSCLQLADARTKMLAGTFVLQGLQHVFCAWGAVHAVTAAGVVWSYREIDLAAQLEALLRRSLHKLALDVARARGCGAADEATLANIHQRWGDHLYSKGEYDAAMTQYLETIGQLEPSYVIRRFLDAQRIHNLTAYLELMHERGLATCDHTTLLLNCYTKLKDVSKLDAFIRRGGVSSAAPHTNTATATATTPVSSAGGPAGVDGSPAAAAAAADSSLVRRPRRHLTSAAAAAYAEAATDKAAGVGSSGVAGGSRKQKQADPPAPPAPTPPSPAGAALRFDPDTAIRVLRGAGYAEHALWVADAAGQIDSVLDILLDELVDADEAITYLEMLPRKRRAEALKKYGKALIGMRAEAATGLIMDLCCGPPPGQQGHGGGGVSGGPSYYLASVSDFAHLYSGEPTALMLLCEYILNTNAAVAAAGHTHTHTHTHTHADGASVENDVGVLVPPARAYERLLYHTLLELYLAEHLWQEASQDSNPQPPQPPQPSGQSPWPEKQGKKQQLEGKSPSQPLKPLKHQQHQQQLKEAHPAMATAASPPAAGAIASGSAAAAQQQAAVMPIPTAAVTTATGGEGTARSPTRTAMAGGSEGNGTAPHHLHHGAAGAPGPAARAPVAGPAGSATSPDTEARHVKALDLLARGWPPHVHLPDTSSGATYDMHGPAYDPDHALVLCRLHGFRKGLLFLYDRLRLPREALQVYMSGGDHAGLISGVLKYGDASRGGDPVLWSEVLEYFVTQHDANPPTSDCSAQIMQVVEHVERSGVLPPLVVLQSLSRSRRLPLSLVRGYMERALQRDTAAVARDREAVSRLAAETAALREEVTKLRTQPRLFQNSRCSASGAPLELPVVHFLCGHSFNLRQLGDNDRECPLCGPDQRRVAEIRHSMQAASLQPERFFAELRQATDGFSVVAEHFGRGLMNVTPAAAAAGAAAAVGPPSLLL